MAEEPFDSAPDPQLGSELRAVLDPGDDPAQFAKRVLSQLPGRQTPWRVLAGWSRQGIAAGILLALALGYWATRQLEPTVASAALEEVTTTDSPVDREALMGVALGGDR